MAENFDVLRAHIHADPRRAANVARYKREMEMSLARYALRRLIGAAVVFLILLFVFTWMFWTLFDRSVWAYLS